MIPAANCYLCVFMTQSVLEFVIKSAQNKSVKLSCKVFHVNKFKNST